MNTSIVKSNRLVFINAWCFKYVVFEFFDYFSVSRKIFTKFFPTVRDLYAEIPEKQSFLCVTRILAFFYNVRRFHRLLGLKTAERLHNGNNTSDFCSRQKY